MMSRIAGVSAAALMIFASACSPQSPSAPVRAEPDAQEQPAQNEAAMQLQAVIDDHWAAALKSAPVFATTMGVRDYDDRLGDPSLAAYDANVEAAKGFVSRLEAIDASALSADEAINRDLLTLILKTDIDAARFGGKYLQMTNRNGPHTYIASLPDRLPFFTLADYQSYIARLRDIPRFLGAMQETLGAGAEAGWTQPCIAMGKVDASIRFHAVDSADDSVLIKPFNERPAVIDEAAWNGLKAEGVAAINEAALPAIKAYADFYTNNYAPACKTTLGAADYENGLDYYAHRAGYFTTTDLSPDEIHKIGLAEVARIRGEMDKIIDEVAFEGDFKAFQEFLRTDPQFYAKTEDELVAVTATISKRIDGELPRLFTVMPRMPYTVKPVPADIAEGTTTAYYEPSAADGSRAGVYRINTSLLDQRPIFELEALTLHEAVPGHHFQIALAQELTLPAFRRFAGFTAFVEGWALYAESLGLDVGFYKDPYQNFGRLSYEMWRACRLVVDTGMHAKGWSRDEAVAFMAENTALSQHNIEAEVDRYIAWPGQALAYKIGQLKIKELREKASAELGADFDLRRFHDALLENGAVPLSILEAKIDDWIAEEKAAR